MKQNKRKNNLIFLQKQVDILEVIKQYLNNGNSLMDDKHEATTHEVVNSFNYNGESFCLSTKHCEDIYKIISDVTLNQTLKDKNVNINTLFKHIRFIIDDVRMSCIVKIKAKKFEPVVITFFSLINNELCDDLVQVVNSLLIQSFTQQMWYKTEENPFGIFSRSYLDLALILGEGVSQWFFSNKVVNEILNLFKITCMADLENFNNESFLRNFYTKNGIIVKDSFIFNWLKLYHLNFINAMNIDCKQTASSVKKVHTTLLANKDFMNDIYKIHVKLGSVFLEKLISNNVLFVTKKETTQTTYLKLHSDYHQDIVLASSHYKPKLYPGMFNTDIDKKSFKFYNKDENLFKLELKKDLEDCLNKYIDHFCINSFFEFFLEYLNEMLSISFDKFLLEESSTSEVSMDIYNFLRSIYFIDIFKVQTLVKDNKYLKRLLLFLSDLNTLTDDDLRNKLSLKVKKLKKDVNKENTKVHFRNLDHILRYDQDSKTLKSKRQNLFITELKLQILDQVTAQKYFIVNFIKDAYIYKHFDYFLIQKNALGVGRLNTLSYFLSFQANKFARSFISCKNTSNMISKNNFDNIKNVFISNSYSTIVSEQLKAFTYEEYVNKIREIKEDYTSTFIPGTSFELLYDSKFNSTLRENLKYIPRTAKSKEILLGLSFAYSIKFPQKAMEPFVSLDSSSSGVQQIAFMLRNKDAAMHGNLLGIEKNDMNKKFLEEFCNTLKNLTEDSKDFLLSINLTRDKILKSKSHEDLLEKILKALSIKLDINFIYKKEHSSLNNFEFIHKFSHLISVNNQKLENLHNITEEKEQKYLALLSTNEQKSLKALLINNHLRVVVCNLIIILLDYTWHSVIFKRQNWFQNVLQDRNIVKQRIMAQAYGMTSLGGYDSIYRNILQFVFDSNIFSDQSIDFGCLNYFVFILNNFFEQYFVKIYFTYMKKYLTLSKLYMKFVRENKLNVNFPLRVQTRFLRWEYYPKLFRTIRVSIKIPDKKSKTRRRFINIYISKNKVDADKTKRAFCALLCHTCDALLLHEFIISSQSIREDLKIFNVTLCFESVHDNFIYNLSFSPFLKFMLKDKYIKQYETQNLKQMIINIFSKANNQIIDQVSALFNNDEQTWNGEITNNYFVKY